ncbi:threonine ammonia-lyase [Phreatobacter aquaticus]|uniref:Threonine ammonia-lyase n=1 Tax=Phreatobacter aquaticus TaxID=2570229 RepID=A0A4D7QPE3_9HYPH|nr:threonine ammonia-lyase [Phreatobacter aquaticus]QCK86827.1 threonine ammonia-lyase [Phreatobacter aquaticus]
MTVSFADIEAARKILAGRVVRTPMLPAQGLSAITGADVFVKYENMQATNSFKERGGLVKLTSLGEVDRKRGVIAMSAGNHAQAVALHAARLGIAATIVMPETTPYVKVAATRAHGARVVLDGETVAEAQARAEEIQIAEGLVWVHPYDDEAVITGQGSIACEMLEDVPDLDCLVIPIGGGGLISGNAIAAKTIRPAIEIVGVEAELYPSMRNALKGETRPIGGPTLAEGIAVKIVGRSTLPIVRELVSDVVLVGETLLERAVNLYLTRQKTIAEGAGAAGLAALLAEPERFRGRKVGLILCGGNIDPRILAAIMVRELEREDRIASFRISIPDRPGMLGKVATLLGRLGANVLEVEHRRLFLDTPAKGAKLDVTVETRDSEHVREIMTAFAAEGLPMAKIIAGGGDLA